MRNINTKEHTEAALHDVITISEYMSSRYPSLHVRMTGKYKVQLMIQFMQTEEKERAINFLMETICSPGSWLQRNAIEILAAICRDQQQKTKELLRTCQPDSLVAMRGRVLFNY